MGLFADKDQYGTLYQEHLLEQWSKCVDMSNSSSDKRISTNNVFITINAALLAVTTFTFDFKNCLLVVIGITVCILWIGSIRSYKRLSKAKFDIINQLEEHLPSSPFTEEWRILCSDNKYRILTKTEVLLPWVFIVMFILSFLVPTCESIFTAANSCITGGAQ